MVKFIVSGMPFRVLTNTHGHVTTVKIKMQNHSVTIPTFLCENSIKEFSLWQVRYCLFSDKAIFFKDRLGLMCRRKVRQNIPQRASMNLIFRKKVISLSLLVWIMTYAFP